MVGVVTSPKLGSQSPSAREDPRLARCVEEEKEEKGALATPSCDPGLKARGFVYRTIDL